MQQSTQQNKSPRPRSKQIQAVATPISKKAAEYAGPTFHHSPAPTKLPPPPFLARSISQQKESHTSLLADGAPSSLPVESSPLSFLFNAMQKEDSMQRLRSESPPVLGFQSQANGHEESAFRSARSAGQGVFHTSSEETPTTPSAKHVRKSPERFAGTENSAPPKKSPWATTEKPQAVSISEQEASSKQENLIPKAQTSAQGVKRTGRPVSDKMKALETQDTKPTGTARTSTNTNKSSRVSLEAPRRKKSSKTGPLTSQNTTPQNATKVTPKKILQREVSEPQPEPRQSPRSDVKPVATRETAASTFKPLRKSTRPSTPQRTPRSEAESEEDLRQQAAHLMSILHLPTPSPRASPRENSPARSFTTTTTTATKNSAQINDPSMIESDLRRLLKLGA